MLTVDQALQLVLDRAQPRMPRRVGLNDALGLVLTEPVVSDIDSPPHDKSIVDGYAVIAADASRPGAELEVVEEVTAGAIATRHVEPGSATGIMTGAPLPPGADAVVMLEQTQAAGERRIRILQAPLKVGQNIMRRAASLARRQTVLAPGRPLRAIELGLLAEVGRHQVQVVPRPSVAILATGNELVECGATPGPAQIRNSNGPLLAGLVRQSGAAPIDLGIARDELADLRKRAAAGLAHGVLLLSGGVSAGVLDLVPQVLSELGVAQVFHKVNLKPGKPLWFGVHQVSDKSEPTLVFGLPGNPVSGLVCFELFVRPAIQKISGLSPKGLQQASAKLARDHQQRGDRPAYWPAAMSRDNDATVAPLDWRGSGDLRTLTDANALAFFPAGDKLFRAGETINVLLLPPA